MDQRQVSVGPPQTWAGSLGPPPRAPAWFSPFPWPPSGFLGGAPAPFSLRALHRVSDPRAHLCADDSPHVVRSPHPHKPAPLWAFPGRQLAASFRLLPTPRPGPGAHPESGHFSPKVALVPESELPQDLLPPLPASALPLTHAATTCTYTVMTSEIKTTTET